MSRFPARALIPVLFLALSPAGPATALDVAILQPRPGVPLFGEVEFEAEVFPEDEIVRVELLIDGRSRARWTEPPIRARVDVGEENVPHRFELVVESTDGGIATSVVTTPPVPVDLEVRVELRQLYVNVARGGRRVPGLERDDFTVFDDGVRQRLVTFEGGEVPFTAVLLLDSSLSMRGPRLSAAVAGARTFARAMRPLDQTKMLLFSDRILHSTPFSGFAEVLTAGLPQVTARGGTALNDHLYLALRLLERRQGRRLVIVLSDGIDVESVLDMSQVLETAERGRSLVYWIRLGSPDPRVRRNSAWRDNAGHRQELELLQKAVATSGGRTVSLSSMADTEAAFSGILDEIREQYVLGYYPSTARGDGSWHPVRVKVRGRGLEVRARSGYLDD